MSRIFGIDICKGNVRSGRIHPRFSLVRVEDGDVVSIEDSVSIPRLFRMLRQEKPDVLAVDSLQEIAADDAGIFRFMASMPAETALVQVTGDGVSMTPLPVLAGRYHIKLDKTNPADEARASALIASYGGGYEVLAFEGVTIITVSRGRSLGRGGWSQNRYVRKVHGGVKAASREIEGNLKSAGLLYSASEDAAFGGVRRVIFEVRGVRSEVPVSSCRYGDVQVSVSPKRRDRIQFLPRSRKNPYVIVGVDPGTTVGVAVLSLSGELLHLESVRAQSPAELISAVSSVGIPVLVATDKAEMPAGVEKIRRVFGAVSWKPKKDILVKDKYAAAEGFSFADDHQRDSLAAALMAYRSYLPKFENVSRRAAEGVDADTVRAGIIRGKPVCVSTVLPDESAGSESVSEIRPQEFDEKDLEILRLEGEVLRLRKLSADLSEDVESKDAALRKISRRLSSMQDERLFQVLSSEEVESRDRELEQTKKALRKEERRCKNLRLRLERMKRYIALTAGDGCLALKVLQQLSRDEIRSMDDEMGVCEDDILYVLKIDGWGRAALRDLAEFHVRAVILPKQTYERARLQHLIDEFRGMDVPVMSGAQLSPRVKGKIGVVNEEAFLAAEGEWRVSQEQYLKERSTSALHGMVAEYQVQRKHDAAIFGIDNSAYAALPSPVPKKEPVRVPQVRVSVQQVPAEPVLPAAVPAVSSPGPSPSKMSAEYTAEKRDASSTVSSAVPAKEVPREAESAKKSSSESILTEKPDILTSVLSTYRKERQKELNHNG
ncbi:MAG TPA: DUF460 domain-containing protein [Methanocorpusculum sp.]|nr:DUF460 domain-containing protein [Methanocorpusculum sp.]